MPAVSAEAIQQAAEYIQRGQPQLAQPLLANYLRQHPDADEAWYWLSFTVPDPKQQIDCLQRVLRYNPAHKQAQARLVEIMTGRSTPVEKPPTPAVAPEPIETPEPKQPAPTPEPTPTPVTGKTNTEPEPISEFADLRKQLSSRRANRPQRKSSKLRVVVLFLIVVAAGSGAAWYFLTQRTPTAPVVVPPVVVTEATATVTATSSPTEPPTITPTRFPPTWTPTPQPTPFPTRTPTPLAAPDAATEASLRTVQNQVAGLRGLPAADLAGRYVAPAEQIRAALASVLEGAGVLNALPDRARVVSALGLTKPAYTLERAAFNRVLDPSGSFYSPWTLEAYVTTNRANGVMHYAFALAAAQASIDQTYEFANTGAYPLCTLNTQQCEAIQALITGDALLVQEQWLKQAAAADDRTDVATFRAPELAVPDDLAPEAIRRDIAFGRSAGLAFVQYLYQRGGWPRVNRAYGALPLSTEQIMHPEKYLAAEAPITLTAPPLTATLGAGWHLISDDVLGEWTTYLILGANADEALRVPDNVAQKAAQGWGGDHLQVYYNDDATATALTAAWTWDSTADANEFEAALSAYLDLRFRGARIEQSGAACWSGNDQVACVYLREKNVLWLLLPDQSLIDPVRASFHDFP